MLDAAAFVTCVKDGLKERGFGHKRIKEITDDFEARLKGYEAQGKNTVTAGQLAMKDVFDTISRASQERAKRTASALAAQAEMVKRVQSGVDAGVSSFLMDGKRGSKGTAIARAGFSFLEDDPRFAGLSYSGRKDAIRGQLYAMFGDTLETVGKGAFGRQKGKAHLPNIAREVMGTATGDVAAKSVADAWLKIADLTVDLVNNAGGTMNRLQRYLPQKHNPVNMAKAGKDAWVKQHMDLADWNKMRWPDGKPIAPKDRQVVLEMVFDTKVTDGANKASPGSFRGQGRAIGNLINDHRFFHYKNADAWLEAHNTYGDGSVFDVLVDHIEHMSHKIALIETFGANPEAALNNLTSIVRKEASKLGARELSDAEAIIKNKIEPVFETMMRQNPMDPHSVSGNLIVGVSNLLTSAQLGSAALLAIPGDFMQTVATRALNNMGMFDGVGMYVKSLATDQKFMRQIATQSGFVMDEVVMSTYAASRWTGVATLGPAASRVVADSVMRLSLMSGHTRAARWSVQAEFMGMMNRFRDTSFDKVPWRQVMERYGITPDEWDALRTHVPTWTPRKDVNFMRPIDILKTDLPNRDALYRKFQVMIGDEARKMVPEATMEAAASLKGTTRPDTLPGAILHSFAMYKNFPISFMMIYGRLGMTASMGKRLAFYAGLGAGMTMVGALGTQMREVSRGRDPMPMDTPAFWGKAFLSGGALSIWGDFLFAGVNEYGGGPAEVAAGPVVGFLGDSTQLLLGDVFQWADNVGRLAETGSGDSFAAKATEFARRYTPGSSIWWARKALESQVFDRLQLLADPKAYSKRQRRMRKQQTEKGNGYWWKLGDTAPSRMPEFGG